jgi:hypothetical protein
LKILLLNPDRSSTLPLDELLLVWPNRYELLCAVVARRALPSLAGQVAERDPEAARRFIEKLDRVLDLDPRASVQAFSEPYRAPVLSALLRRRGHDILGEME